MPTKIKAKNNAVFQLNTARIRIAKSIIIEYIIKPTVPPKTRTPLSNFLISLSRLPTLVLRLPQWMHCGAESDISLPQSGHFIRGILFISFISSSLILTQKFSLTIFSTLNHLIYNHRKPRQPKKLQLLKIELQQGLKRLGRSLQT